MTFNTAQTFILGLLTLNLFAIEFVPMDRNYGAGDRARWQTSIRDRQVVLTYDDGPFLHYTPQLLDLLRDQNVKATFFINTHGLLQDRAKVDIVLRMFREGHIVASHDHTHGNNTREPLDRHRRDLIESIVTIERLERMAGVNQKEMYFRYPFGSYGFVTRYNENYHHLNVLRDVGLELYDENCMNYVFWDIDTADWVSGMTASRIFQNMKSYIDGGPGWQHYRNGNTWSVRPIQIRGIGGGVALMHDRSRKVIDATRMFIRWAKNNDVEIVNLNAGREFDYDYHAKTCELQN